MTSAHTLPLIVFIHSWSGRASDWDECLQSLSPQLSKDYQLIALDLPGHGAKRPQEGQEEERDWSIPGLAKSLVNQLPSEPPITLVGHSMGGCVALEAALLLGARAQQVILVDTFGLPYGDLDQASIQAIEQPFHDDFVAAMHALVDNTTPASLAPETRTWIKTRMASAHQPSMLAIWHQLLRWSPERVFKQLRCPIHALNGEQIPQVAQERCAPYVKTQVLAGCQHFPQFEQPGLFVAALHKCLITQMGDGNLSTST